MKRYIALGLLLIFLISIFCVVAQQRSIAMLEQSNNTLKLKLSELTNQEKQPTAENGPVSQPAFYQNKNMSCKAWQDKIPDWKTYTNHEYRFTFTYPGTGIQINNHQAVDCSIDTISYPAKEAMKNGYVNPEKMRILYFPYIISIYENNDKSSICNNFKESPFVNPDYFYPAVNADESCAVNYNGFLYRAQYRKGQTVLSIGRVQSSNSNFDCNPISEYDFTKCFPSNNAPTYCKISEQIRKEQSIYMDWDITKSIRFF